MVTNPDTINPKAFSQKSCHLCLKMECLCHNHYNVFYAFHRSFISWFQEHDCSISL